MFRNEEEQKNVNERKAILGTVNMMTVNYLLDCIHMNKEEFNCSYGYKEHNDDNEDGLIYGAYSLRVFAILEQPGIEIWIPGTSMLIFCDSGIPEHLNSEILG